VATPYDSPQAQVVDLSGAPFSEMRPRYLAAIPVLLTLFIAGCGTVTSTEAPIGEGVTAIDPKDWEGTWLMYVPGAEIVNVDFLTFQVKVIDADNGVLSVTGLRDSKKEGGPELKNVRVYLRYRPSDYWLWSVKSSDLSEDPDKPLVYLWGIA